jgi:hypothetical protein
MQVDVVSQGPHHEAFPSVLDAYQRVARMAAEGAAFEETLRGIANQAAALLGVNRCSVFLKEPQSNLFRGFAAAAAEGVEAVPRMVCGVDADRFTQEIVANRRPVFVHDAQHDGRPVRAAMQRWKVHDVLGVPITAGGEVIGILFLDEVDKRRTFSDEEQKVAAMFAGLAGEMIAFAQRFSDLQHTAGVLQAQVKTLRRMSTVESAFARLSVSGGAPATIAELAAKLSGNPCCIYDSAFRKIACSAPAGSPLPGFLTTDITTAPALRDVLADLPADEPGLVKAMPEHGIRHRVLLSKLMVEGAAWGYLVIVESARRLTSIDQAVARHAAQAMSVELRIERRISKIARAHADAAPEFLSMEPPVQERRRRAALEGLFVDAPYVVCLVASRRGNVRPLPEPAAIANAYGDGVALCSQAGSDRIVLVLEAPDTPGCGRALETVRARLEAMLDALHPSGGLSATASSVVSVDRFPTAREEADHLMHCLQNVCSESRRTLTVADVGVGRLLLGKAKAAEVTRFVNDAVGPLLSEGGRMSDLLMTLDVFLTGASRSAREAAKRLNVPENTIRYRLTRITELTGLDVASDLDDQLTAQLALLIIKLQGGQIAEAANSRATSADLSLAAQAQAQALVAA